MKIKNHILLAISLLILITTGCTPSARPNPSNSEPISRTEFLMDTVMTIKLYYETDEKVLDKVFSRLQEIENRMSATIATSDVSKINDSAGIEPVTVNEDTYFVLSKAIEYAELSNGAYDPTIGPLVDLWNIQAEEKERQSIPSQAEIDETKALIDYNKLELLDNNQVFLKDQNMKIVLGSIVKGYAADEVERILTENGVEAAIIDLGGNVFAHGEKSDGSSWNIGIRNPLTVTGNYLGIVQVKDKSIVTSGGYERYFEYGGKKYHHILDRETGYPSENEIVGISIISDKSIDGDALSTTIFILGLNRGMELVNSLEGVDAIFLTNDNSVYLTDNLKDKFTLNNGTTFIIKEY